MGQACGKGSPWRSTKAHMREVTIFDTKLAQASRETQPAKIHQPVVKWQIIIDCFKLLHLGVVYYKVTYKDLPGKSHGPRSLVGLWCMGSLGVEHDWVASLSLFSFMHWRRKWQPTPVFLPGESQGWGSLVGCHLWGCTELDTTEVT